jgi:hypothetical protein
LVLLLLLRTLTLGRVRYGLCLRCDLEAQQWGDRRDFRPHVHGMLLDGRPLKEDAQLLPAHLVGRDAIQA